MGYNGHSYLGTQLTYSSKYENCSLPQYNGVLPLIGINEGSYGMNQSCQKCILLSPIVSNQTKYQQQSILGIPTNSCGNACTETASTLLIEDTYDGIMKTIGQTTSNTTLNVTWNFTICPTEYKPSTNITFCFMKNTTDTNIHILDSTLQIQTLAVNGIEMKSVVGRENYVFQGALTFENGKALDITVGYAGQRGSAETALYSKEFSDFINTNASGICMPSPLSSKTGQVVYPEVVRKPKKSSSQISYILLIGIICAVVTIFLIVAYVIWKYKRGDDGKDMGSSTTTPIMSFDDGPTAANQFSGSFPTDTVQLTNTDGSLVMPGDTSADNRFSWCSVAFEENESSGPPTTSPAPL